MPAASSGPSAPSAKTLGSTRAARLSLSGAPPTPRPRPGATRRSSAGPVRRGPRRRQTSTSARSTRLSGGFSDLTRSPRSTASTRRRSSGLGYRCIHSLPPPPPPLRPTAPPSAVAAPHHTVAGAFVRPLQHQQPDPSGILSAAGADSVAGAAPAPRPGGSVGTLGSRKSSAPVALPPPAPAPGAAAAAAVAGPPAAAADAVVHPESAHEGCNFSVVVAGRAHQRHGRGRRVGVVQRVGVKISHRLEHRICLPNPGCPGARWSGGGTHWVSTGSHGGPGGRRGRTCLLSTTFSSASASLALTWPLLLPRLLVRLTKSIGSVLSRMSQC